MSVDVLLDESGDDLLVDAWGESHGCVKNRLVGVCIRITTGRRGVMRGKKRVLTCGDKKSVVCRFISSFYFLHPG